MVFDTLREFGVSVYALEDGPKNGNHAPSFHIIDHVKAGEGTLTGTQRLSK